MGKWGGGSEDALKEKNREGAHMKIRAPHLVSMASSSRYQAPEKDLENSQASAPKHRASW